MTSSLDHPGGGPPANIDIQNSVRMQTGSAPPSREAPFYWGVATAGRQFEGGLDRDDWEIFTTDPQILRRLESFRRKYRLLINPQPAGIALNHWDLEQFSASVDRARALGLNAYRFSIEWSRVEPTPGSFDNAALAGYQAMVDTVRSRGMEPFVVLSHLSLPAWVSTPPRVTSYIPLVGPGASDADPEYRASLRGWESTDTVDVYVRYVEHVARQLHGVRYWITFNEPLATTILTGYMASVFPPGFLAGGRKARLAVHNFIAAHARAYEAIHAIDPEALVGITDQWLHCRPIPRGTNLDRRASEQFEYYHQDYLLNALVHGREDIAISLRKPRHVRVLGIPESEWRPHLDFFGLQYYKSVYPHWFLPVAMSAPFLGGVIDVDLARVRHPHGLLNDMGWEVYPEGLYQALMKLKRITRFEGRDLPLLVAENGTAEVVDNNRSAYLTAHLEQMERARQEGASIFGYMHWSISDNWEWIDGYRPETRLGLFSVEGLGGSATSPRHAITDGALAFAHAVHNAPASFVSAVCRYGRYRSDGTVVEHPSASPDATFAGTLDGWPITLLLSVAGPLPDPFPNRYHGIYGMLFYGESRRWVGVKNIVWEPATRTLRFSHPDLDGGEKRPERIFSGTLDQEGVLLRGTLSEMPEESMRPGNWEATRATMAGMWQSRVKGETTMTLSLSSPEGIWRGRLLHEREWIPLASLDVDLSGCRAMMLGAPFEIRLDGEALVVSSSGVRLFRLPDGLPFEPSRS